MDINSEIQRLDWNKSPKGLYEPIGYALASGGKRLRPTLCLLGAQVFGGDEQKVLPAALALEMFHNFTLLHDDVMDHAQVRRGRACVHIKWNENTAILSGDQLLIEAYRQLNKLPSQQQPTVLRLFNKMATEVCEGQQYDVDFGDTDAQKEVSLNDYMEMIRLKTSVLLATALQIGAYLAGASLEQQEALYEYGIHLGLAFQIQDDYLDCYGDEQTFGKAIGGDIREGKKTWLWLTAEEVRGERFEVKDRQEYTYIISEYNRLGVPQAALTQIEALTTKALACLEQVPHNDATGQLKQLAHQLVNRKS